MISIKHRLTSAPLGEFDALTVKAAAEKGKSDLRHAELAGADLAGAELAGADLCDADLCDADMRGANLRGANLRGANLTGADLRGADLDGEQLTQAPIAIVGLRYWALISDGFMRLGCQRHTHAAWAAFSDAEIIAMDGKNALAFWRQWKVPLLAMCAGHAALIGEFGA